MPSLLSRSHHSPPVSDQDRRSGHAYALRFDGDDHIAIAAAQDLSEISYPTIRLTLSCWVYPKTINNAGRILERSDNDTDDRIVFALDERNQGIQLNINGKIVTAPDLPLNRWSHVAGTYDGEKIRLYINGDFQTEVSYSGIIDLTEADLWIGNNLAGNRPFTGDLDEVQIWYRTLNARDIQQGMTSPHASDDRGLMTHWSFNQPPAMTLDDQVDGIPLMLGTTRSATVSIDSPRQVKIR